jgi:phosphoglycolate phosphatase-like HAD superfamily hydrolase
MPKEQQQAWMGHVCGMCLALRDNAGQPSRITTNYDAALLSVLCEAQSDAEPERHTSYCPLRSHFKADVTAPSSHAAKYAASIALTIGATKIDDHIDDNETFLQHVPTFAKGLARAWHAKGQTLAQQLGFASDTITQQTNRQAEVEAASHGNFFRYAEPTELAVASAFAHTAIVANKPHNAPALTEMGRMFGRMMYLLDSYQDFDADVKAGKFNALAASFPKADIAQQVREMFAEAFKALKEHFDKLELPRPELAQMLLLEQLQARGQRILGACGRSCSCQTSNGVHQNGIRHAIHSIPNMPNMFVRLSSQEEEEERHRSCGCCEVVCCVSIEHCCDSNDCCDANDCEGGCGECCSC